MPHLKIQYLVGLFWLFSKTILVPTKIQIDTSRSQMFHPELSETCHPTPTPGPCTSENKDWMNPKARGRNNFIYTAHYILQSALHPFLDPLSLQPGETGNVVTPPHHPFYRGGHSEAWMGGAPRPPLDFVVLTSLSSPIPATCKFSPGTEASNGGRDRFRVAGSSRRWTAHLPPGGRIQYPLPQFGRTEGRRGSGRGSPGAGGRVRGQGGQGEE